MKMPAHNTKRTGGLRRVAVMAVTCAALAVTFSGCGSSVPYPPKHETQAQREKRHFCEAFAHGDRGSDQWRRWVLGCAGERS